ncbi:AprI/Inh family metalloprotease inhibitor [Roseibium litorale]|uniref:AprI/Inh family metalloprotease inhibitor n=1 Tax=Roseibium litorale TaxID=2803841 RepID=A0ABR9CSY5_9HYPH|nr:AprI/Inh family metalloprotease inhibitor [Roseibium litorale]MBD8893991.1 AprI/Inh family metalloprotease inhibitor [Roseibium litorale]
MLLLPVIVAGCQTDGPPDGYSRPSGYGVSEPGWISPPPFGGQISKDYSRSKTRTWVSEDGTRHTRSSGSNVRMSVDPNAAAGMMSDLLGGGSSLPGYHSAARPDAYLGKWRVAAAGRECELTLSQGRANGGRASVFGCMNTDLIKVGSWSLRGYELVLSSFVGDPVASLRVTQPNRMDGSIQGGTPMTAWR